MHYQPTLAHVDCVSPPFSRVDLIQEMQPVSGEGGNCMGQGGVPRRMAYWDWAAESGCNDHVVVCVHGLSRQGRDFDVLARALRQSVRVVCPDVVGRGQSDWLEDPMAYQIPTYVQDMVALLAQLREQGAKTVDWVGTSMGGLIGVVMASQPDHVPVAWQVSTLETENPANCLAQPCPAGYPRLNEGGVALLAQLARATAL